MENIEKIVYSYNEDKVYTGEYKCQQDQLDGGFLIPANCSETAPVIEPGKVPVYEDGVWVNKTNDIGKLFIDSDGQVKQISELGDFDNILTAEQAEQVFAGKSVKVENGAIIVFDISDTKEYKVANLKAQIREASLDLLDGNITPAEHSAIVTRLQAEITEVQNG